MIKRTETDLSSRTISDFGDQWTRYTDNSGFYGSVELLDDIFGPLLSRHEIQDCRAAEIGSGTGRIVRMLLEAGVGHVTAVEPSQAFDVLAENLKPYQGRVTLLRIRGDELPPQLGLDLIISIGVIHHIPDPSPVLQAAFRALRPGGRCLIWLYGHEGNEVVVFGIKLLRSLTTRFPHWAVAALAHVCVVFLDVYSIIVKISPFDLPLARYIRNVIGKFSRQKRYLVIYDQLRPAFAKYYREDEARKLLHQAGFEAIQTYHRDKYSWTVLGVRPM